MKKFTTAAVISTALCSLSATGCIEDSAITGNPKAGIAVKFATTIKTTSRAYDNVWEADDLIGVYMLPAAGPEADRADADWTKTPPLFANMQYHHGHASESENVVFLGIDDDNTMMWPADGSAVDFVAYYPWRPTEELPGFVYPVDITDQSCPRAIDLMYADNVRGVTGGDPMLTFGHRLAKLVFNVTDLDDVSLEGMVSTFRGLSATAGFNLATGAMGPYPEIEPEAEAEAGADPETDPAPEEETFDALLVSTADAEPGDGDNDLIPETAIVEAIVLPGDELTYTLTFYIPASDEKAIFRVPAAKYEAGKRYSYDINLITETGEKVGLGELNSITAWTDIEDTESHELPKTDPDDDTGTGEKGAAWPSGPLSGESGDYTVTGSYTEIADVGLSVTAGNSITIEKNDYEGGVESVSVNMRRPIGSTGRISSVRVGGTALISSDSGTGELNLASGSGNTTDYVFFVPDGKLASGTIEIRLEVTASSISVNSFGINQ